MEIATRKVMQSQLEFHMLTLGDYTRRYRSQISRLYLKTSRNLYLNVRKAPIPSSLESLFASKEMREPPN